MPEKKPKARRPARRKTGAKTTKKKAPNKGESKTSPRRIRATVKQMKALRLRFMGMHFQDIADELGYKSPSGAQQAVERAKALLPMEDAKNLKEMELLKLMELERAMFPKALSGNPSAVHAIVRIMNRRARYLGLDAAKKVDGKLDVSATGAAKRLAILAFLNDEPADG